MLNEQTGSCHQSPFVLLKFNHPRPSLSNRLLQQKYVHLPVKSPVKYMYRQTSHFEIHNSAIFIYIHVFAIRAIETSSPMFENPAEKQFHSDAHVILIPNILFHQLKIQNISAYGNWFLFSTAVNGIEFRDVLLNRLLNRFCY